MAGGQLFDHDHVLGFIVYVQGPAQSPGVMDKHIETTLKLVRAELAKIPQKAFESIKAAIIRNIE